MYLRDCPTETEWDLYLFDPERVERERLEKHLEECHYCHFIVETRRAELANETKPSAAHIPREPFLLRPLEIESIPMPHLLAAQGEMAATREAVTLASRNKEIHIRIFRETTTGSLLLYLFSDNQREVANAMVKLSGIDHEMVADSQGMIDLGNISWPQTRTLEAEVRLARSAFALSPLRDQSDKGGEIILTSRAGDQIRVVIDLTVKGRRITIEPLFIAGLEATHALKVGVREAGNPIVILDSGPNINERATTDVSARVPIHIYLFE